MTDSENQAVPDGGAPTIDALAIARAYFSARGMPCFVVGGRVRDSLLGRAAPDTDLIVLDDAAGHARAIARECGAGWVLLDGERDIARVVWPDAAGSPTLDIARIQAPDLEADLRQRDFTVNAMAVPITDPWPPARDQVLDPTGGREDLALRKIRMTSASALDADPLRLLRAVRLAAELDFEIEADTDLAIRERPQKLSAAAAERSRDEFLRIMDVNPASDWVSRLAELGLLGVLIPELAAGSLDPTSALGDHQSRPGSATQTGMSLLGRPDAGEALRLGLGRLDALERVWALVGASGPHQDGPEDTSSEATVSKDGPEFRPNLEPTGAMRKLPHEPREPEIGDTRAAANLGTSALRRFAHSLRPFLEENVIGGYSRITWLKLGALLSALTPESGRSAALVDGRARALRLPGQAEAYLRRLVGQQKRFAELTESGEALSRLEIYRTFRSSGDAGVDGALLAIATRLAEPGGASAEGAGAILGVAETLWGAWFEQYGTLVAPPPLLNGHDILDEFQIPPGPKVGAILEAVMEAQVEGRVVDRASALALVETEWART